jgi:methionyl aminopeptidase
MTVLKTQGEIELMDEANAIVHQVLDFIEETVAPGVTTKELDREAEAMIRAAGAVPGFLNYRGFPATLCTALNDVIVHGIPNDEPLKDGDILGIDCGVLYKGYYGDAARTFAVGKVSQDSRRLLDATRESLQRAIAQVHPGARLSDIGHAVQSYVESQGFSVVRDFVGHGVGTSLHEEPQIPNFGRPGRGPKLRPGMVLAIEPMVNAGMPGVKMDADGWTARTADGQLSAHFEFSVAVTPAGARILGVSPAVGAHSARSQSSGAA